MGRQIDVIHIQCNGLRVLFEIQKLFDKSDLNNPLLSNLSTKELTDVVRDGGKWQQHHELMGESYAGSYQKVHGRCLHGGMLFLSDDW